MGQEAKEMKARETPFAHFMAGLTVLFVFVFVATWFALAQPKSGPPSDTDKKPASDIPSSDIEVNLDVLETVRDGEKPAAGAQRETPMAAKPAAAPETATEEAAPAVAPPPVAEQTSNNLPPPIVPEQSHVSKAGAPEQVPAADPALTAETFNDRLLRLLFDAGSPALTFEAAGELDGLTGDLLGNSVRLEVHAYAGGPDGSSSDNRRLSLKRALAVRGYLVEKDIAAARIDIHAEGSAPDSDPADRVDIRFHVP